MAKIQIEVAAALPDRQIVVSLTVDQGTTVLEAVQASGIKERLRDMTIDEKRLGIFGRICPPDRILSAGDRVELYRPLQADPKEVRRRLAELERVGQKAQ